MQKTSGNSAQSDGQNLQRVNTCATLTGMAAVFFFLLMIVVVYYFPPQSPALENLPVSRTPTATPTETPTSSPPTGTPSPRVELLSVKYLQSGAGCQVDLTVKVTGSAVSGAFHVWHANDPLAGLAEARTILPVGLSAGHLITLGGLEPKSYTHELWFESNGMQSNRLKGLICPGLTPVP